MKNTTDEKKRKLQAALASAQTTVALLRAELDDLARRPADDAWLTLSELQTEYQLGREAVVAAAERGELSITRGARRRIMARRSEIERWLDSRRFTPGMRRAPATDLDAWDTEAERAMGGAE